MKPCDTVATKIDLVFLICILFQRDHATSCSPYSPPPPLLFSLSDEVLIQCLTSGCQPNFLWDNDCNDSWSKYLDLAMNNCILFLVWQPSDTLYP